MNNMGMGRSVEMGKLERRLLFEGFVLFVLAS